MEQVPSLSLISSTKKRLNVLFHHYLFVNLCKDQFFQDNRVNSRVSAILIMTPRSCQMKAIIRIAVESVVCCQLLVALIFSRSWVRYDVFLCYHTGPIFLV